MSLQSYRGTRTHIESLASRRLGQFGTARRMPTFQVKRDALAFEDAPRSVVVGYQRPAALGRASAALKTPAALAAAEALAAVREECGDDVSHADTQGVRIRRRQSR
jgi:hypothetical protein